MSPAVAAEQRRRIKISMVAGLSACLGLAYGLARVQADGAPQAQPLWYSGSVSDADGKPLDSNYNVTLRLFERQQPQAGELPACEADAKSTRIARGRFRIDVSSCSAALKANPDLYAELTIGDDVNAGKPFERAKIGAVPFALEAQHALSASKAEGGLAAQVVPAGAVMAFDLDACPAGWSELAGARGRAIVGVNPAAAGGISARQRGAAFGAESITLAATQLPPHAHSGTTAVGAEAIPGATNAYRDYNTNGCGQSAVGYAYRSDQNCYGHSAFDHTHAFATDNGPGTSQPVSVMQPSLALLYCKKS